MRPKKNLKNAAEQGVKLVSIHTLNKEEDGTGETGV